MTINDTVRTSASRPGWPEVLVGLAALGLVGFGGSILLVRTLDMSPAVSGVVLGAMSGIGGLAGFVAAALVHRARRRGVAWADFGIRRTTGKWLLLGVAGGVVATIAKVVLTPLFTALTGAPTDTQADYAAGSQGGVLTLVLSIVALAVLTPIGEEFLFRGVVTTALLRYGPWVATLGSAAVFAVFHGINVVLPAAFVVGVVAAELRRRSGSVWPGVVVHAVNNLISVLVLSALPALS